MRNTNPIPVNPEHSPRAISIGCGDHPEFADVRLQVLARLPEGWAGVWPTVADFASAATAEIAPELVIVWQQSPDDYSADDVVEILACVPLARVVCVYGAWCESDGRTRHIWPAALRVPVWQAARRIDGELRALRSQTDIRLPWTASREEVWLHDVVQSPIGQLDGFRIAIAIFDPALRAAIAEQLSRTGGTIVDQEADSDSLLMDLEPWTEERRDAVKVEIAADANRSVIGLAAWSIRDLQREWLELGLSAVVPKLDPLVLCQTLAELCSGRES